MPAARILCIIDTVGRGGGAEQLISSLIPAIRQQGGDVEVAALYRWDDDLGEDLVKAGVPVHRLNLPPGLSPIASRAALKRLTRDGRFNLFWGHLVAGNFHARAASAMTPCSASVITLHSEGYACAPPASWRGRLSVLAERLAFTGADGKVAVSKAVADDYGACFGWSDIDVLHNAVDVSALREAAATGDGPALRARLGFGPDDFVIVTPARYVPKKGQIYLIEAIRKLRDEHGVIIKSYMCGVGPEMDNLRRIVSDAGLAAQIRIDPVIAHTWLLPLITSADAVVMPSLREPFGIAAAEAMAIGAPVILSAVDGFVELVGTSDGARLVPAADSSALASALLALRADPEGARAMGERAAAHIAATFGIEQCASRWLAYLNRIHDAKVTA